MCKYLLRSLIFLVLFTPAAPAHWTPPVPVVVAATVEKGSVQEGLQVPGSFIALNDVVIRAKTEGEVEEVFFEDGAEVKKGDLLFRLRDRENKALFDKAQAEVTLNSSQLKRAKEIRSRGFLSPAELDKVEAQFSQAMAELSIAKEGVEKTQITAPFRGVLSSRKISVGAYVKNFDELVRLQDIEPLRFEFQIPVQKLALIKNGQAVQLLTDVHPGEVFAGKIIVVEPSADQKTRNVKILAEFPNKGRRLIPGMFGSVSLKTADQHEGVVIPEEALVVRKDGLFVYKIVSEDKDEKVTLKAKLIKIQVGTRFDDRAEVLSGLAVGDQIVLKGQDKINDDTEIKLPESKA